MYHGILAKHETHCLIIILGGGLIFFFCKNVLQTDTTAEFCKFQEEKSEFCYDLNVKALSQSKRMQVKVDTENLYAEKLKTRVLLLCAKQLKFSMAATDAGERQIKARHTV